jgi:hypothetical protein
VFIPKEELGGGNKKKKFIITMEREIENFI